MRKEEKKKAREKGKKIYQVDAEFQRIAKKDKNFLNEQYKEIEENNRMGKTRDLLKKTGDIKGTFHARMGRYKGQKWKGPNRSKKIKKR